MDEFETMLDHEMSKSTLCDPSRINAAENRSGFYSMVKTVQSFTYTNDIRPKLRNCTIPALIMRGQCDGIKWGYMTEYLDLFANHTLVIVPGAGHSIAREQPEVYITTILAFLNK
jgi:proline iminopeptidase